MKEVSINTELFNIKRHKVQGFRFFPFKAERREKAPLRTPPRLFVTAKRGGGETANNLLADK